MPTKNDYKPTLVQFMNFAFGEGSIICTSESDITDNELLQATPEHVARCLKYRAHGTPDPGPDVWREGCLGIRIMGGMPFGPLMVLPACISPTSVIVGLSVGQSIT